MAQAPGDHWRVSLQAGWVSAPVAGPERLYVVQPGLALVRQQRRRFRVHGGCSSIWWPWLEPPGGSKGLQDPVALYLIAFGGLLLAAVLLDDLAQPIGSSCREFCWCWRLGHQLVDNDIRGGSEPLLSLPGANQHPPALDRGAQHRWISTSTTSASDGGRQSARPLDTSGGPDHRTVSQCSLG